MELSDITTYAEGRKGPSENMELMKKIAIVH